MNYNKKDMTKELRSRAKELGMTFRVKCNVTINGSSLYQLIDRKTKRALIDNYKLLSAYEDSHSGYWHKIKEK